MQTAEIVEFPVVRDSKYLGISIDLDRDKKLSEQALKLLNIFFKEFRKKFFLKSPKVIKLTK